MRRLMLFVTICVCIPALTHAQIKPITTSSTKIPTVIKPVEVTIKRGVERFLQEINVANAAALTQLWSASIRSKAGGYSFGHATGEGVGGRILVSVSDTNDDTGKTTHKMMSLAPSNGQAIWTQVTEGMGLVGRLSPYSQMVQVGDFIVGHDRFGGLYGFSAQDGKQLWIKSISGADQTIDEVENGLVYTANGSVIEVNPANGQTRTCGGSLTTAMCCVSNGIAYSTSAAGINAGQVTDGKSIWSLMPTWSRRTKVACDSQRVYWLVNGKVYAYDAKTGNIIWQHAISSNQPGVYPLVKGNALYVVADNGLVVALNSDTGAELWQTAVPYAKGFSPMPLINDVLFVTGGPEVAAINTANGQKLWTFKDPINTTDFVMVYNNTTVVIGDGMSVYAFTVR